MRAIFKREFRSYFTSPIGFVYIGAYILALNIVFYLNNAVGGYTSLTGAFGFMMQIMMFAMPFLTMRVFSEEYKAKTDQLLFTAPVKISSIVVGKFFGALLVFVLLLLLTLLWPLVIAFWGENNVAELVGNYVSLLCIGAAYISMGVFISSLTENQIIAAIGSLGLFIGLYLVEILTLYFSGNGVFPAWLVTALQFFSIFRRYDSVSLGVFTFADIVYYLSVVAVFLFLTVRRLESRRWA